MNAYDEPVYLISVVAKMLDIHPQTLRQYEREGFVTPGRTDGKMRLYSQKNIDEIKIVLSLTRNMGVNIASVDIILQLKKEIEILKNEIEDIKSNSNKIPKNRSIILKKNDYKIVFIR